MNTEITNTTDAPASPSAGLHQTEVVLKFKLWHSSPFDDDPAEEFRWFFDLSAASEALQSSVINQTIAEGHKVVATLGRTEITDHCPESAETEAY